MPNLQITLTTPAAATVEVKSAKAALSSVLIGPQTSIATLGDVSVGSIPDNGDVLQYDASLSKYIVDSLNIQGGTF